MIGNILGSCHMSNGFLLTWLIIKPSEMSLVLRQITQSMINRVQRDVGQSIGVMSINHATTN